MDIVVIGSNQIKNKARKKTVVPAPRQKAQFVERRRNLKDRRKGVGDGVVVRLSYPNDRRVLPDRRTTQND